MCDLSLGNHTTPTSTSLHPQHCQSPVYLTQAAPSLHLHADDELVVPLLFGQCCFNPFYVKQTIRAQWASH